MAAARRFVVVGDLSLGAPGPAADATAAALGRLLETPDPDFGLVIAGNLFDVTDAILEPEDGPTTFGESDATARVRALTSRHRGLFDTMGRFLGEGGRVTWLPGDGDADLLWPECREVLAEALGPAAGAFRFQLRRSLRLPGGVWVEHGSSRVSADALPDLDDPITDGAVQAAPSTLAAIERWGADREGWRSARAPGPTSVALGDLDAAGITAALDGAAEEILEERTRLAAVVFGHHPTPRTPPDDEPGWWAPGPLCHGAAQWAVNIVVEGGDVALSLLDLGPSDTAEGGEEGTLAVLIAAAQPGAHVMELRDLLEEAGAEVEALTGATYDALMDVLASGRHTALHLVAPHQERYGRSELMLAHPDREGGDPLRSDDLAELLLGTGIRLLVLEASAESLDDFGQAVLSRAGLAGVVTATGQGFEDELAEFGRTFWRAVSHGQGLAAAARVAGGSAAGQGLRWIGIRGVGDLPQEPKASAQTGPEPEAQDAADQAEPALEGEREPGAAEARLEAEAGPEPEADSKEDPTAKDEPEPDPAAAPEPGPAAAPEPEETPEPETEPEPEPEPELELVLPEGFWERALAWSASGRPLVIYGPRRSGRRTLCEAIARRTGLVADIVEDWEGGEIAPVLATAAGPVDDRDGRAVCLGPLHCDDPDRESTVARRIAWGRVSTNPEGATEGFEEAAACVLGFAAVARASGCVVGTGRVVDALTFVACALEAGATSPLEAADEAIAVDLTPTGRGLSPKALGPLRKWAAKAKGASKAAPRPATALERTVAALDALKDSGDPS